LQIAVFGKNGPDLLTTIAAAVFLAVTVGEGSVEEGTRCNALVFLAAQRL